MENELFFNLKKKNMGSLEWKMMYLFLTKYLFLLFTPRRTRFPLVIMPRQHVLEWQAVVATLTKP